MDNKRTEKKEKIITTPKTIVPSLNEYQKNMGEGKRISNETKRSTIRTLQ